MGRKYSDRIDRIPDERKDEFREFSLTRYLEENRWAWTDSDQEAHAGSEVREFEDIDVGTWYWDKRSRKAVVPVRTDDRTVRLLSVWHWEEVTGALANEQLVPIDQLGPDHKGNVFEEGLPLDSFRLLDEDELDRYLEIHETESDD